MKAGLVVKDYTVSRLLGHGTAGTVWLATLGEQSVALKVFRKGWEAIADQEEIALRAISSPHVVSLIDRTQHEDSPVLILSLAHGRKLNSWLQKIKEPLDAVPVLKQLAEALADIHEAGWVHGDVKASNVLVSDVGDVMLLDLGVACRAGEQKSAIVASVHTASPEQIQQHKLTPAVDSYAFGALLYRTLAGRYPFHSTNAAEVLGSHVHAEPPSLSEDTNPLLASLCLDCLAKDPTTRPTAQQIAKRLSGVDVQAEEEIDNSAVVVVVLTSIVSFAAGYLIWMFAA